LANVVNDSFTNARDALFRENPRRRQRRRTRKRLIQLDVFRTSQTRSTRVQGTRKVRRMHKPTPQIVSAPNEKSTCFENNGQTSSAFEPFASMAVIDLVHLSRQTMGDSILETELLTLFQGQALHCAERLADLEGASAAKRGRDLAHTLKGSALAIGAFKLARAAAIYEEAIRAGASDSEVERRTLSAAIAEARHAIAPLLERN
jgi:HPt (histidine-containing phosphotransfer) domain-containing protein